MVNLDTHILVDVMQDTLRARERRALEAYDEWAISDVVLWELAMLVGRRRIKLDLDSRELHEVIATLRVLPISLDVARTAQTLDFNKDPFDRVIAATSIVHAIPLVTRDAQIRTSKLVSFA